MDMIKDFFSQILVFAKDYGLPLTKKRGILREFLQTKILEIIYQEKKSNQIVFIGGTSLRLLRGLDRFSEDLDFDLDKISFDDIDKLMVSLADRLKKENISVEVYRNLTKKRNYYELRFKELLFELNISQRREEKLVVKLDFESFWQGEKKEAILLNRYGILAQVVTINLNQLLVQKLFAYLNRAQTQPRDLYDIVWLVGHQAYLDINFIKKNKLSSNLVNNTLAKFENEKKKLKGYKKKLEPFLVNEKNIDRINFLPYLLKKI